MSFFLIPTQSEEKVAFAITLFLSFAVFLNILDSILPENSENTSFLCLYVVIELTVSVFILIITAVQIRICHRNPSTPFSIFHRKLIDISRRVTCYRRYQFPPKADDKNEIEIKSEVTSSEETDWTALCSAVDVLAFCAMLIIHVFVITALMTLTFVYR